MSRSIACGIVACALCCGGAFGQYSTSPKLSVTTKQVVAFKDGHALFTKQANGRIDESGKVYLADVPQSISLGSFWATPRSGALRKITANRWIEIEQGQQKPRSALLFQFDPASVPNGTVGLTLQYSRPGVRWIPTYRVNLEKDEALLEMQAEIMNEAEDLEGVDLRLVVGTPNFQFKEVPSPMVFEATMVNPLARVAPGMMNQSQGVFQGSSSGSASAVFGPSLAGDWMPQELKGEALHDLFIYEIPAFSLNTGERSIVPVTSTRVPVRHVYTWALNIAQFRLRQQQQVQEQVPQPNLSKDQIWHAVDLTNKTSRPWTMGPAFFIDSALPVAQTVIKYTPIETKCRVPLTPAPDVIGEYLESELERQVEASEIDGDAYSRIKNKVTLRITNRKQDRIDLEVENELGGNVLTASDEAKITRTDYQPSDWPQYWGGHGLNGHSTVAWTLSLDGGAATELHYEYEYFVP